MLIAGNDNWPAEVRVIDDGDECNNAEHGATVQDLADRSVFLRKGVPGIATSLRVKVPLIAVANLSSRFAFNAHPGATSTVDRLGWLQTDVTDGGGLLFYVPPQVLGRIVSVRARLRGSDPGMGGIAHGALPSNLPQLRLYRSVNGAAATQVATATDGSANVVAYDAEHYIELAGLDEAINSVTEFAIQLRGEHGTNAVANRLALYALEVEYAAAA